MTLILSLLTYEFAMQASDQRLTDLATGVLHDDLANKANLFDNAMSLAYTGISEIPGTRDPRPGVQGRRRTDDWIFDVLMENRRSLPGALRAVTNGLTALVGQRYHLAVVGVGWGMGKSTPIPIYFRTSNFLNAAGNRCPIQPQFTERYEWHKYPWKPQGFFFREAGQTLSSDERRDLTSVIRGCLRHRSRPRHIQRALVDTIRRAAVRLEQGGAP